MKPKFYHPFALDLTELQDLLDRHPRHSQDNPQTSNQDSNPTSPDEPIMTTMALGEEGGNIPSEPPDDGDVTTLAFGEEGGDVTTLALGEEGGNYLPVDDGGATTEALGEEGGSYPEEPIDDDGMATTFAIGEEGGSYPEEPIDDDGMATTFAIGEEGGSYPEEPVDDGMATTFAIGEEGGDSIDCPDWALFDPFPPTPIYPQPGQTSHFFDLTNNPDSVLLTPGLLANHPGGLRGLEGSDYIVGSEDSELIHGNGDCDYIVGGEGSDSVYGGKGHDRIQGNEGDDLIHGNKQEDILAGNDGNDTIYGGRDDDFLTGGVGNDLLSGDRGNDTLVGVDPDYIPCGPAEICPAFHPGELERDTLIGGEGSDVFVLGDAQSIYYDDSHIVFIVPPSPDQPPPSYALIADFTVGEDTIQLKGGIDYTLENVSLENGASGLGIFFETDAGQNQLIGILQNVRSADLTIERGAEITTIT